MQSEDVNKDGLESLLSVFSMTAKGKSQHISVGGYIPLHKQMERANQYYDYVYKTLDVDYTLSDIELFSKQDIKINSREKATRLGLFISAAINKVIKSGEKVNIYTKTPLNCLFYRLEDATAYTNKAGALFGAYAKRSDIRANEVGSLAGFSTEDLKLNVENAGELLSALALNCITNVGTAGDFLGLMARQCKIYADKAGYGAGVYTINSEVCVGGVRIKPKFSELSSYKLGEL